MAERKRLCSDAYVFDVSECSNCILQMSSVSSASISIQHGFQHLDLNWLIVTHSVTSFRLCASSTVSMFSSVFVCACVRVYACACVCECVCAYMYACTYQHFVFGFRPFHVFDQFLVQDNQSQSTSRPISIVQ